MAPKNRSDPSNQQELEVTLWRIADKLRGNLAPGEYRPLVLGLVFYKHVSDICNQQDASRGAGMSGGAINVPAAARWQHLLERQTSGPLSRSIDDALLQLENANPGLGGALPRNFERSGVDEDRLRGLVELITTMDFGARNEMQDHDVLGRVYEYFLGQFAVAGGRAGEDYTPRSVVKLLVEMLQPFDGSVYDPCCGTGGMFIQSAEFVTEHGGSLDGLRIFGQEFNDNSLKLARMNLALRGIQSDLGSRPADSLLEDMHAGRRFDYVLANPPFNVSNWATEQAISTSEWPLGTPSPLNANFAWVSHFVNHLADGGHAGFVLANGALTSTNKQDAAIRRRLVEDGYLSCVVGLPAKLFSNTGIPVSLWFLRRPASGVSHSREGEVLFMDARTLSAPLNRRQTQLPDGVIQLLSERYAAWLGRPGAAAYEDEPGFCRSVSGEVIRAERYLLTPGRFVGSTVDLVEPLETPAEEVRRLSKELLEQLSASAALEAQISEMLRAVE